MEKQYKITDESGDKKYFTQIPNIIVNHSTAYEQSLYLVMKRLAGEHGSCFASLNWISKKMGVHKTTVSKTITKLLKRKWIEEVQGKKVLGGTVRQFTIVDLWKINMQEYESGAGMTTNVSGAIKKESGALVDESGAQSDPKKNDKKIYIKKKSFSSFKKKKKPYFMGEEMRRAQGKLWVIPSCGGQWLEFVGREGEIEWR